jgi:hypothetical protein
MYLPFVKETIFDDSRLKRPEKFSLGSLFLYLISFTTPLSFVQVGNLRVLNLPAISILKARPDLGFRSFRNHSPCPFVSISIIVVKNINASAQINDERELDSGEPKGSNWSGLCRPGYLTL